MPKYYIPGSISDPEIEAVYLDDLREHYKHLHKTGLTPLGYGEMFWKNAGIFNPEKVFRTKEW